MTRHVTFYHAETGLLMSRSLLASDDRLIELNTPAGHVAIDHPPGEMLDYLSQRVNVQTREIEEYQPPQPSTDHEWHAASKRWRLSAAAAEREAAIAMLPARLAELRERQHDATLTMLLGRGGADDLREIDAEIRALKAHTGPTSRDDSKDL